MSSKMKVSIGSHDEPNNKKLQVEAQYVQKELQIDKTVPWTKKQTSKQDMPDMEFTGGEGRTLSLELLFDSVEQNESIQDKVEAVLALAKTREDPENKATAEDKKRPHQVAVVFGTLPRFIGVIQSVSTKYTMFNEQGLPTRATCTIKVQEADKVSFKTGQ